MAPPADLDELTVELYRGPPEDFVARRKDGARRLKDAGRAEDAARFAKLAKPSLSAWVLNVLAGSAPETVGAVVAAGDELRSALEDGADAAAIRAAQRARQQVIRRATDDAVTAAGRKVGDAHREEIAATLEAAAADPDAAANLRAGRLVRPLEAPIGFAPLAGLTLISGGRAGEPARRRGDTTTAAADPDGRPASRAGRSGRAGRTDEAAEPDAIRRAEAATTAAAASDATARADELERRLDELEGQRRRLDDELRRLDDELSTTRRDARQARREAEQAGRRASRAQHRLDRADG